MNGIIARYKKSILVAFVAIIMNINAARVEKCDPCQETRVAKKARVNIAKASVQAVQAALITAATPIAQDAALDVVNLVSSNIACASCAEGTIAQASLQDALDTSLDAAGEDAAQLASIDAIDEILNTIESYIEAHK